jgi:hypothetical protein
MGICQSSNQNNKKSNRGKQPYCAKVNDYYNNENSTNLETTINTVSQIDILSNNEFIKKNPSPLYKYSGHYYKKGEQTSLMTISLHELQGNSNSLNNKTKNSQIYCNTKDNDSIYKITRINENDNESSSESIEIINDGRMDEKMVQKSTDKTTIENYNEYIGKNDNIVKKNNNKTDIYKRRKCVKKRNNNSLKNNDDNNDRDSDISGIPSSPFNNFKFGKKNNI